MLGLLEALLAAFRRLPVNERGLAPSTVDGYLLRARLFLSGWTRGRRRRVELEGLPAADVTAFVAGQAGQRASVGSTQYFVVGAAVVPAVLLLSRADVPRRWSAAVPPRGGGAGPRCPAASGRGVARLLASCDRRRAVGRRDYAILVLLAAAGAARRRGRRA